MKNNLFLSTAFLIILASCSMFDEPYSAKVLVYHQLTEDEGETSYCRNLDKFREDLEYLTSLGVDIISYNELVIRLNSGLILDRPAVVITFDDGISSDYEFAYPILKEFNIPATFFLLSSRTGNWSNYKEMLAYRNSDGEQLFYLGSHSYQHIKHAFLNEEELVFQFSKARSVFSAYFGFNPVYLALPFGSGFDSSTVRNTAKASGFESIRGIVPGLINKYSDPFHIC